MSYVYEDDKPAEDMVARDHYIKASILASTALDYAGKLTGHVSESYRVTHQANFNNYAQLAMIHAKLAENYVNGETDLADLIG
jgi:hypothetical protein